MIVELPDRPLLAVLPYSIKDAQMFFKNKPAQNYQIYVDKYEKDIYPFWYPNDLTLENNKPPFKRKIKVYLKFFFRLLKKI